MSATQCCQKQWLWRSLKQSRFLKKNTFSSCPMLAAQRVGLSKKAAPAPRSYESLSSTLSKKTHPTLLYQTCGGRGYILGCYAVGGAFIAMGIINGLPLAGRPSGFGGEETPLPPYVPVFIFISSLGLVYMGLFVLHRPQNMIKSIKAIPQPSKTGQSSILLEIERTQAIPFRSLPKVLINPLEVTMSSPVWLGKNEQIAREMASLKEREARSNAWSREKGGLLSLPFRQGAYYIGRGVSSLIRAFTSSGFLNFHVKGQWFSWKLDHRTGWALNEGEALDKLVKIRAA